jgi:predicted Zn-ribbon and HTH transcriptional regulator
MTDAANRARTVSLTRIRCRTCGHDLAFESNGKLKIRIPSRMLAVSLADGSCDMTCPNCKSDTKIPLRFIAQP